MYDEKTKANIEIYNAGTGMSHRTQPYDMSNISDLKEVFKYTVAACMDYRQYWFELSNLQGQFDESFETFDPGAWLNMITDPKKSDKLMLTLSMPMRR